MDALMTNRRTQLLRGVRTCVARILRIRPEEVAPAASLVGLGVDSLDRLDLIFRLQQDYDVELSRPEVTASGLTVEGLTDVVLAATGKAERAGEDLSGGCR